MCLEDLGLLYASELLRKPCLQPYLLRFQNLSPIYLPTVQRIRQEVHCQASLLRREIQFWKTFIRFGRMLRLNLAAHRKRHHSQMKLETKKDCNTLSCKLDHETLNYTVESQLRNVDVGVVSGQEAETQEEVLEPMDERKLSISSSEVVAESECLSGSVEVNEAKTVKLRADLQNLVHRRVKKEQMLWSGLLEKCAGLVKQEKYKLVCLHHLGHFHLFR
ncbi:hypothetical protein HID58_019672 [Brassica napus]|uniref:Uncharacterized protein n=1 Tax=Brassica napus TaxID=3708 RepID=A0ABQ8DDI8_BRANA|nr:hypothetical protein HID58_019672 [Brassica napus]